VSCALLRDTQQSTGRTDIKKIELGSSRQSKITHNSR